MAKTAISFKPKLLKNPAEPLSVERDSFRSEACAWALRRLLCVSLVFESVV